jgi:drug/metabolite transporter (DMT)-like permease
MGILLGLTAALLYGASDFGGGLLSRRLGPVRVNLTGSAAATALAWAVLLLSGGPGPSVRAIAWGLASGLGGGAGTLILYRGLARGQMSVVGPVSAVGAAAVPVLAGVALGERPSPLSVAGVLFALPAIALVATSGGAARGVGRTALADGLAAGLAFGVMFTGLAQAGQHAGLWPVAAEQSSSLLLVLVLAVKSGTPLRTGLRRAGRSTAGVRRAGVSRVGLSRAGLGHADLDSAALRSIANAVLVGIGGMTATLLFFLANRFSMLATTAVLVSLYPGVTVLLARAVLGERFSGAQRAGLGLCALAVVVIALN